MAWGPKLALAIVAAMLVIVPAALAGKGDTKLISRQSAAAGGGGADGSSNSPVVSGNGRFVAFHSDADNLGGPINPAVDTNTYVRDLKTKRTRLVSRAGDGGPGGNGDSGFASISANGRFIAFNTDATNLGGPLDQDALSNIYVHDRKTGRTTLVSRQSRAAGGAGGDGSSLNPFISANGRFVAFQTFSENLGGPIETGLRNIYVYDRKSKRTRLVSRQGPGVGGAGADDDSFDPSISADGRMVTFETSADNLGGPIEPAVLRHVYVHDRKTRRTRLVSRAGNDGPGADDQADSAVISGNGRFVAFQTSADNLGGPTDVSPFIYIHDLRRRTTRLVSRQSAAAGGAGADGSSADPWISGSGRFVTFETGADNLGGPLEDVQNVYVYDRRTRHVKLASRERNGGPGGDGGSFDPSISLDGRFVAFRTLADNLGGPLDVDVGNLYRNQFRR